MSLAAFLVRKQSSSAHRTWPKPGINRTDCLGSVLMDCREDTRRPVIQQGQRLGIRPGNNHIPLFPTPTKQRPKVVETSIGDMRATIHVGCWHMNSTPLYKNCSKSHGI